MRKLYNTTLLLALFALAAPAAAQTATDARLWDAAIAGDTAAIRSAVAAGADLASLDTRSSQNGRRALNWAAIHNHPEAITLLLSLGAELEGVNRTGFTALHHAAEYNSVDAGRTLLAAGADPAHANVAGWLPIETARERGSTAMIELLQAAGD